MIEPFRRDHLAVVSALEQSAGDVHWSRRHFESELDEERSRFFVFIEGSEITGYAGYWKVADEAQLTNIVVHPDHRRRGLGRQLLKTLMEKAAAEHCKIFTLEVRAGNPAALALYKEAGFHETSRRMRRYVDPIDDAVLMEKIL